jgi:hypothetical protein
MNEKVMYSTASRERFGPVQMRNIPFNAVSVEISQNDIDLLTVPVHI